MVEASRDHRGTELSRQYLGMVEATIEGSPIETYGVAVKGPLRCVLLGSVSALHPRLRLTNLPPPKVIMRAMVRVMRRMSCTTRWSYPFILKLTAEQLKMLESVLQLHCVFADCC